MSHMRSGGEGPPPGGGGDGPGGGKRPPQLMAPRPMKTLAFWLTLVVLVLLAFNLYHLSKPEEKQIHFGRFYEEVLAGNVDKVTISSRKD